MKTIYEEREVKSLIDYIGTGKSKLIKVHKGDLLRVQAEEIFKEIEEESSCGDFISLNKKHFKDIKKRFLGDRK